MADIVSFEMLKARREQRSTCERWMSYYAEQPYEELLEALVYEHEHDFPLRESLDPRDRSRHDALVKILDQKAQTQFLRSFLDEIKSS
jgi:hypothetical protein